MRRHTLALGLFFLLPAAACGDSNDPDAGPMFEQPQILPSLSPICLTPGYIPTYTRVGTTKTQPVQLLNFGAQTLAITSAAFIDPSAPVFTMQGVEPMSITYDQQAIAQLVYQPTAPGWDYATLQVISNAQNFPDLRIFTLGLAVPGNLDAGSESQWDAGPKPAAAFDMNVEICPIDSGVR